MQKGLGKIVVLLLCVLVILEGLRFTKTDEAMYHNVFDYQVIFVNDLTLETDLKLMGNGGWEIVNARRASSDGTYGYEFILKKTRLVKKK